MTRTEAIPLLAMVAASGLVWTAHTLYGLALGYSFWFDELFSIVTAAHPPADQIRLLLQDVHPPFYQLALAIWGAVFGLGEGASRALSALAILASLLSLRILGRQFGLRLACLTGFILLQNWLVVYYAQDARGYALLLALAQWAFVLFVTQERRWIFVALFALGLTHYFGTLLAAAILAWISIERRRDARVIALAVLTGALIVTWPILFLLFGTGQHMIGGNFWIRTAPLESFRNLIAAGFPILGGWLQLLNPLLPRPALAAFLGLVLLGLGAGLWTAVRNETPAVTSALARAVYLCVFVVFFVEVITLHTPIGTVRNFVVIIPPVSFLLALALAQIALLPRSGLVLGVVLAGLFLSGQVQIATRLAPKLAPLQDWRLVAHEAETYQREHPEARLFFFWSPGPSADFFLAMGEFYLGQGGDRTRRLSRVYFDDLERLSAGDLILFGHLGNLGSGGPCENELTRTLTAEGVGFVSYFAPQSRSCENGFVRLLSDPRDR